MLQGWGSCLVDKCDRFSPIFFEGVDRLDDRRAFVLARDPIFVLLGVHPTSFDDAQANFDDVTIVHQVACRACVGCADEEARCKGFESVSRMPVGGHSLAIFFTIFGRCFAVLRDEPIEHV